MSDAPVRLDGACVLILEDDYYLANDLQTVLEAAGATVIGPFPDQAAAARALGELRPDCAFVDVNLGEGPTFEVPRELRRRGVPFAFVTGYDAGTIPAEFDGTDRFEKPVDARRVTGIALRMIAGGARFDPAGPQVRPS